MPAPEDASAAPAKRGRKRPLPPQSPLGPPCRTDAGLQPRPRLLHSPRAFKRCRVRPVLLPGLLALALAACADFPELEGAVDAKAARAPYPELLPHDAVIAATTPDTTADDPGAALAAGAAALKARAAGLGGPILPPAERARLASCPEGATAAPCVASPGANG